MRGEFIVPVVALVILAGALILSALAPDIDPARQVSEASPVVTGTAETSTALPGVTTTASGYPAATSMTSPTIVASEPFIYPTPDITGTTTFSSTIVAIGPGTGSGYPNPGSGPEPIGAAPGGIVPNVPTDPAMNPFPPSNNPISVPTPALIYPTAAPVVPPANNYPAPQPTQPRSQPAQNNPQPPRSAPDPPPVPTQPTEDPADIGVPTAAPGTTQQPVATQQPVTPTPETPTVAVTPTPEATPVPPTPTARPSEILTGNLRWSAGNSPVTLQKDHALAAGSSLTIDPGVEVRLAPGVQFTIGGVLRAQGSAGAPVRFVGMGGRWDGIVGTQGSTIILDQAQVRQAGQTGTAVSSTGGSLTVRNTTITDNGGGIVSIGSALDLRNTQITGNSIGGPAVHVRLPSRGAVTILNTIVGGNGTPGGAAQVLLSAEQSAGPITVEGNLFVGGAGPGLLINTGAPLTGSIRCNGFNSGTIGLQLAARRPDVAGFNLAIENNAFEGQSTYGATGTLAFNVANNWWSDPSGPQDAQRNPQGRGVPVGVNLQFQPWRADRPACAPTR